MRTRNARLVAIHSFFRFAALRHPEHAASIQRVLAIPLKRTDRPLVTFLTRPEIDALLSAPERTTWIGRRDHALLAVAIQTGLRVSELTALCCGDVVLGTGAHLGCHGKGRKQRHTPLTGHTQKVLDTWMAERQGDAVDPLFPSRRGGALSRDAVELLVARHAATAKQHCPSLRTKTVTPHVLRHSCAMTLLHAGIDVTVIALWLGHETSKQPTPTSTPTSPSKNKRWPRPHPRTPPPGAIAHPTRCSPSSKASNLDFRSGSCVEVWSGVYRGGKVNRSRRLFHQGIGTSRVW